MGSTVARALGMTNLFKTPTPPESPPPPTTDTKATDTKATQQAVAEATARRSKARGFQSTILSDLGSNVGGPKTTIGS